MEFQRKINLAKAFWLACSIAGMVWIGGCSAGNNDAEQSATHTGQTGTVSPDAQATAPAASDKGVGPVSTVELSATIDTALATQGKAIFESKCAACHKFGERYVGPSLAGVTERRKPEWIMNMILNPQEMIQQDPGVYDADA
jgi:mono/diheme cytochrome c family protein